MFVTSIIGITTGKPSQSVYSKLELFAPIASHDHCTHGAIVVVVEVVDVELELVVVVLDGGINVVVVYVVYVELLLVVVVVGQGSESTIITSAPNNNEPSITQPVLRILGNIIVPPTVMKVLHSTASQTVSLGLVPVASKL